MAAIDPEIDMQANHFRDGLIMEHYQRNQEKTRAEASKLDGALATLADTIGQSHQGLANTIAQSHQGLLEAVGKPRTAMLIKDPRTGKTIGAKSVTEE